MSSMDLVSRKISRRFLEPARRVTQHIRPGLTLAIVILIALCGSMLIEAEERGPCLPCAAERARKRIEELARERQVQNARAAAMASQGDAAFSRRFGGYQAATTMQAAGESSQPSLKAHYDLGNQPSYTVEMGPVSLRYRGAVVRMREGHRVTTREFEFGPPQTFCDGSFQSLYAYSGWVTELIPDRSTFMEPQWAMLYRTGWMKGFLTRTAVRTWTQEAHDNCHRFAARYVYRYRYHAPDGSVVSFFQRPHETPLQSNFSIECGLNSSTPREPSSYWSSSGNASLDTTNMCKPVIRWPDGSVEEFHPATSEPEVWNAGPFHIAPPFTPTCSAADSLAELRHIDANGNITKFQYGTDAEGLSTQTMIDNLDRQTILKYDTSDLGVPRLRSVETPSIGNAPPFRHTITWRRLSVDFGTAWPDVICEQEFAPGVGCGGGIGVDVVDTVTNPDGTTYVFDYGPWGNLISVKEPGGAVREYDYGGADNAEYAAAVVPLVNQVESTLLCGSAWSGYSVDMQKRGITHERVFPNGRGGPKFEKVYKFFSRQLSGFGCSFGSLGAASAGPAACSQVWMEVREPDGSVTKTGMATRALPPPVEPPKDDVFAVPPNAAETSHGLSIGTEKWQDDKLLAAEYNGDKETGELWYSADLVKIRASTLAVPANVRPRKIRIVRDGLTTTTNLLYGNTIDINPSASATETRNTGFVTSSCQFAGIVGADGCSPIGATPLARIDSTYKHYFPGTPNGRNVLGLQTSERLFGPNAGGTAFSTAPLTETMFNFDEFAVKASGLPSSVLDSSLGLAAGAQRGNLTSTRSRVTANKSVTTEVRYYDNGDLESEVDAMGRKTVFMPTFALCSSTPTLTATVTNAASHTYSQTNDCLSGLVLKETDENDLSTFVQYDHLGRVVETADPGDVLTALPQTGSLAFTRHPEAPTGSGTSIGQARVTSWKQYFDLGNPGSQREVVRVRDGSPGGLYTKSFLDGLGRVVQSRTKADPTQTGNLAEEVTTTVYDGLGRTPTTFAPCFAPASDTQTANCGKVLSSTTYDGVGRELTLALPGNRTITKQYHNDGGRWLQTMLTPRGFTTKTYSNLLGQEVQVDEQSPRCSGFCTTKYEYDAAGRLLTITDHLGNKIVQGYDDLGRHTSLSDPDMGNWTFEYDNNGNLTKQIDARGQAIVFEYDVLNRLTLKDLPPLRVNQNAPAGPEDVTYSYDGSGPLPPLETTNPVPILSSINPEEVMAGSGPFILTVDGSNFVSSSIVRLNGIDRQTTFVNSTRLTAQILASDTSKASAITVFNPGPGGGISGEKTLSVAMAVTNDSLFVSQFVPPTLTAGQTAEVTVTMQNTGTTTWTAAEQYRLGSQSPQDNTLWRDGRVELPSSVPPGAQVTFRFDITAPSAPATYLFQWRMLREAVEWFGAFTPQLSITVTPANNPAPTITGITPGSATAGGGALTLTVDGSNFISSSVVRVNGADRTTTFVSPTRLTGQVTPADTQNAGSLAIAVFNPAPGGGTSNAASLTVNNSAPLLTSISPTSVVAGGAAFTITVDGSNFMSGSVVRLNGGDRATTFVNATRLTAQIPSTDIQSAGSPTITVFNPAPGGGTSNPATLTVSPPNNPAPTLGSISPGSVVAGSGAFTLTATGSNFVSGAVVRLNGSNRATSFVSATQLTAQILASDVSAANSYAITVVNPAPGGGESGAVFLAVTVPNNPLPTLSGISPSVVSTTSGPLTLTATGSNFVSGAVVRVNGADRATTFDGPTQLRAQIPATDVQTAGPRTITVFNPAPGGGASGPVTLTINNPLPVVSSLSPGTVTVGSGPLTLSVNGSNFVPGAIVRINNSDRQTSSVSSTTLTVQISAADIQAAGPIQVSVLNPAPGGGLSGSVSLNVVGMKPLYKASVDFARVQGQNNWNYLDSNGTPMTYDSANNWWQGGEQFLLLWAGGGHPSNSADAVRQWRAPGPGTVRITGRAFDENPGGGDGVAVSIKKGTTVLWQTTILNADAVGATYDVTTSVVTGDRISFVINKRGESTFDSTNFDPAVSYSPSYKASTDFSNTQGQNNWNYVDANGTPMTYDAANNLWQGGEQFLLLWATGGHPTNVNDAVRQWRAPVPGTIRITGRAFDENPGGGDGVVVSIRQGATVLWQQTINNGDATGPSYDITTAVAAGEVISFVINKRGESNFDSTNFDPAIGLTPTPRASSDFSTLQGQNNWSYADSNGTAMSYDSVNGFWQGGEQFLLLFRGGGHPGNTVDSVREWRAPGSGTIRITGRAFDANPGGGDGVIVSIKKATTVLWQQTIANGDATGFSFDVSTTVTAGDPIRFVINKRGEWNFDGTAFDPTISFTADVLPTLSSINPSVVLAGGSGFSLGVTGGNFVSGASVRINGVDRTTTFNSSTSLTAQITAADIQTAGTRAITVLNPGPDGGISNTVGLTINNPLPSLSSITPNSVVAGAATFTLTVNGSNFVNGSMVRFNGGDRPTTFVNSGQLTAQISASDVSAPNIVSITVFNPVPGGGLSGTATLTVTAPANPVPTLSSISPTRLTVGSGDSTITVTGSNFVSGAVVRFNGVSLATSTTVNPGQLAAVIPSANLQTATTVPITVFNPAPGGGTSTSLPLTIEAAGTLSLNIQAWNVFQCQGTDLVCDPIRQARTMVQSNPDIILTSEILSRDLNTYLAELSRLTGGTTWHSHFVPICNRTNPWSCNGTSGQGQAIFSKIAPSSKTEKFFANQDRSAAAMTFDNINGQRVVVVSTHLAANDWDHAGNTADLRASAMAEMKAWASGLAPVQIIGGDFNFGPTWMFGSATELSQMTSAGYVEAWQKNLGEGAAWSYPDNPPSMHTLTRRDRIDYIFYTGPGLNATSSSIRDIRDHNNTAVVKKDTNTPDDFFVRPSDHNMVEAVIAVARVTDATPPTVAITAPPNGATVSGPITVTASASDDVGVAGVQFKLDGNNLGAEDVIAPYSTSWNTASVSNGSHVLTAVARDAAGKTSSASITVTVNNTIGLPSPWVNQDVGMPAVAGRAAYANGTFTLEGKGTDIWGSAEAFHYVHRPMTGDGTIIARVDSIANATDEFAMAGVMIRDSLAADAPHATMVVMPTFSGRAKFRSRLTTGGATTSKGPGAGSVTLPYWVKLVRTGSTVEGFHSANGITWTSEGTVTIPFGASARMGLVLTSHDNSTLVTATITNVTPAPSTSGPAVSAIAPSSGTTAGGTAVTISGSGFVSGATVTIGGTAATSVTVVSNTSITATTPAHTAGGVDVVVRNPDTQSGTLPNGFTYVTPGGLPSPWVNQDVGVPAIPGSATYANGTFTLQGKGTDIFNNSEAFHYVHRAMTGDGTIIARVDSIANATDEFAMAGVMIRDSLAADAPHATMVVMPTFSGRAKFRSRLTTGGATTSKGPGAGVITLPYWVKLVRTGSTVEGFHSANGTTWTSEGTVTIPFGASARMGLVLTSHDNSTLVTATITNVTPPPSTSGPAVSAIAPSSGTTAGGTAVTISGSGFVSGATVTIGGTAATSVNVVSSTSITATTPAHTAGGVDVVVRNPDTQSATLPNGFTYVTPSGLPSPWVNQDVGVPAVPGSATYANGTFTLQGKGTDIWGSAEAFHYVHRPMTGDGTIIARVDSIANATDEFAMAGVMIRDSLAADAPHATMVVMPTFSGRAKFRSRLTTGGATTSKGPGAGAITLPYWVKLVRTGSTVEGFHSANGTTWTSEGTVTIPFGLNTQMGLVLTSHDNSTLVTATITNVSP